MALAVNRIILKLVRGKPGISIPKTKVKMALSGTDYYNQADGYAWIMQGNFSIVDLLPEDMVPLAGDHWTQFKPVNPLWHSLLGVSMIVFGMLAVVGNGTVLYLFGTTKYLRTPNNLLVMNLALSDFGMMAYMVPTMAFNCFKYTWVLGPFQCELYGLLGSIFGCVSIWSNVMITLDRYNVIVRGVGAEPLTHKKAVIMNLIVWSMGTGWTILPMFGWNRYVLEGNLTTCWTRLLAKKMNVASLRANSDQQKTSTEIKLAKIAIATTMLWFMAWTPYLVQTWGGVFTDGAFLTPLSSAWGAVFAKFSACYNPIVYGISHPKYRQALFTKFPALACGNGTGSGSDDTKSVVSEMTTVDNKSAKEMEATKESS
ncbi:Lateral eye opsin [Nymphon striatum]|nr:Lateral eye opsin [Nymphon striatum]